MSDHMSILFATTVLALGGLGLYMLKSDDPSVDAYSEEGWFDKGSTATQALQNFGQFSLGDLFGSAEPEPEDNRMPKHKANDDDASSSESEEEVEREPRRRPKTQKNRKPSGNSRRRF